MERSTQGKSENNRADQGKRKSGAALSQPGSTGFSPFEDVMMTFGPPLNRSESAAAFCDKHGMTYTIEEVQESTVIQTVRLSAPPMHRYHSLAHSALSHNVS